MPPELCLRDSSQWVHQNEILIKGSAFELHSTDLLTAADIAERIQDAESTAEITNSPR